MHQKTTVSKMQEVGDGKAYESKCRYDFGSTTELMITVVNDRIGKLRKEKIVILSRNNPIEFMCEECGRKCCYRSAIHRGWESAVIAEVIFIQTSLFRISSVC